MITNFDYLKNEEKFKAFADVAVSAEKIILIDPEACVINWSQGDGIRGKMDVLC